MRNSHRIKGEERRKNRMRGERNEAEKKDGKEQK